MNKKESIYKNVIFNPLNFVKDISLINNFPVGIVVYLIYLVLFSLYVYIQIRNRNEILPHESGLIFFAERIINYDIENLRLARLVINLFSAEILRLFIISIVLFGIASILTRKKTNLSQIVTILTVSYLIPCYVFLAGIILSFLPLSFVIFKVAEITFLISLYEAFSKGFGISKAKAFFVLFVVITAQALLYVYVPSVFLTPFFI
ncbi:hypothetical protein [Caldicellulosiruptor naganoensis]|uniref:Yip1 domain-containing protein n=1 Tax=Caldicellulosiruptor naganoensis TaxID=29324 RepID=A0ABY7BE27_9FIRM|nr:hypothetical protein [Caldicellulosiruptor naganoensis]WAM31077.1 hypothetical protein OTJ99_001889 [Caldicellulosiruptor naganoensis]